MAPDGIKSRLDEILKGYIAPPTATVPKDKLLAGAFVVVDRNETLYSGAAGHLCFEPDSAKYTVDSVSWEASITKLVTSVCLLQLVERGLVSLDEDVKSRIPQLKEMKILTNFDETGKPVLKENEKPITLRRLLTHTSGLAYPNLHPLLKAWTKAVGRASDANLRGLEYYTTPLVFAPGESWTYGIGLDWAGQLLEKITGQRLGAYMQEHIFGPLGMSSTSFQPQEIPDVEKRRTAVGRRSAEDQTLTPLAGFSRDPAEGEIDHGGGGLFGSPADYAKFLQAILQGRLLSRKMTDELFAPQLDTQQRAALQQIAANFQDMMLPEFDVGTPVDHGLGGVVNTQEIPGRRHGGSMQWGGMLNSRWWIDRKAGIAGVFFTSILPIGDPVVKRVYKELEEEVYSGLSEKRSLPCL